MEIEGSQKTDLDPEARGCTADNQFSGNQADLTACDFDDAFDAEKEVDLGMNEHDLLPELPELRETGRTQTKGKYNLRKSLAWDSAFFTSAGVLDAEELSSMITAADKGKKNLLPGIQEDVTGSTESLSTLESDDLNLETLEEELFVDIRASIQRSNKKATGLTNSCEKKAGAEVDGASISSLKSDSVTPSSQDKNLKPSSKRATGLETVAISKSLAKQNAAKQVSRKLIKHDPGQSQMISVGKIAEKNPTLNRTSKIMSNSNTTSTTVKRDSIGIGRGKSQCGSSKLGASATTASKVTEPPKVSVGAGKILPRPAVPSKSSMLKSSTRGRVQSTRSSTSSGSSNGLSSGAPPRSLTVRRNPGGSGNAAAGTSVSIPKTLSSTAVRKKTSQPMLSPHLKSKVSSSVSPASSISDWSSVSSSSSSMVTRKFNNLRGSIDTSSTRSTDGDTMPSHSRNPSANQTSGGHKNQEVSLSSNIARKTSTTVPVLASMKPSGLRMPSPKIGFFDGVKSSPRTPNGQKPSQPGLRTALPKNGAAASSPSRISNGKLKGTKVPPTRMSTSSSRSKPDSPRFTSLTSSQEKSHASINSSVSLDVKDSPSSFLGVKGNESGEECQKAEKVQVDDGMKQVVDAGADAIIKGNLGDLRVDDFVESYEVVDLDSVNQKEVLPNQNDIENNSHENCHTSEKENSHEKYEREGLTGYKTVCRLMNELSCNEHDTNRPPFALKNEICDNECIDGSRELDALVGGATSERESLL